ncbi:MAG: hypothetical protein AAF202_14245, partial [Pseudomonadota bacterium]
QVMSSLMIETMADIWPDLIIFDPTSNKNRPTRAIVNEYKKRFKLVVIKTNSLSTEYPLKEYGVMTSSLEFAQQVFAQKTKP